MADDIQPVVQFGLANWTVLLVYLAAMVAIGLYCSRRLKTTEDFFLAGRRIPAWAAALSIFGTQLSAITFMAIPATAYSDNWVRMIGQFMILPVLVLVIFCYLPFYRRLNICTAYEYLERRFSVAVRIFGSSLFILLQLGRMGIVLYLPAIALSAVTGMNVYLCIGLMGVLATAYTVLGGIEAVIWTDVVQVIVLMGGALLCLALACSEVGGISNVISVAAADDKFTMFLSGWDATEMVPWVMIVGLFFANLIPYSTDQTVVQRYLTTRDESQAARSLWINFAITLPAASVFFALGTALYVFYSAHPELALPQRTDQIVPWFVVHQLAPGVAGLVIAAIFAAAMSSLDSSMNSIATAYITDFYRRFNSAVSDERCLRLARWLTLILGALGTSVGMLMAFILTDNAADQAEQSGGQSIKLVFDLFNQILGLFGGSLSGVFILGVFTKRATARGALLGAIVAALVTALIVFFPQLDWLISTVSGVQPKWPAAVVYFSKINLFLHAAVGTMTCVIVGYLVSLADVTCKKEIDGLTIYTLAKNGS